MENVKRIPYGVSNFVTVMEQNLRTRLVLGIPNNNVRKQYYEYLLEEYQSHQLIDLNNVLL